MPPPPQKMDVMLSPIIPTNTNGSTTTRQQQHQQQQKFPAAIPPSPASYMTGQSTINHCGMPMSQQQQVPTSSGSQGSDGPQFPAVPMYDVGEYVQEVQVAKGATSHVYLRRTVDNKFYILKRITVRRRELLDREIYIARQQCAHPNIIKYHDFLVTSGDHNVLLPMLHSNASFSNLDGGGINSNKSFGCVPRLHPNHRQQQQQHPPPPSSSSSHHQHIVGVVGGHHSCCIVMEYMNLGSLLRVTDKRRENVRKASPFDDPATGSDVTIASEMSWRVQMAKCVGLTVLSALHYLHDFEKRIHRDIKPPNILLDKSGRVKLCDFDTTVSGQQQQGGGMHTTLCGTVCYSAPEVLFKREQTFACDIWSFGVVLYELAAGTKPYTISPLDSPDVYKEKMTKVKFDVIQDERLREVVQMCLQYEASDRPQSVQLLQHPLFAELLAEDRDKQATRELSRLGVKVGSITEEYESLLTIVRNIQGCSSSSSLVDSSKNFTSATTMESNAISNSTITTTTATTIATPAPVNYESSPTTAIRQAAGTESMPTTRATATTSENQRSESSVSLSSQELSPKSTDTKQEQKRTNSSSSSTTSIVNVMGVKNVLKRLLYQRQQKVVETLRYLLQEIPTLDQEFMPNGATQCCGGGGGQ